MVQVVKTVCDLCDGHDTQAKYTRPVPFSGKDLELDLCDEHCEEFDRDLGAYAEKAHAPVEHKQLARGSREAFPTFAPKPVRGESWWNDPNRPFSNETKELFREARRQVRDWARENGWPHLSDRGAMPQAAADAWFDAVWSTMKPPSWRRLAKMEGAEKNLQGPRRKSVPVATS